ncbi:tetratricopeptide repeat protein [Microbulbifer thermotolerans]|uniref:Tetratricopeptide repeat protein n=1 Tax=Microbulbifer thermotolerans TaxID=252514 RepID=A0AB35I0N4_MICTH|nr:tetratricopeptide repeat protein [Microbulbifer thermotolerans]MCX2780669.1 tetratricopeptide repeat protein [Microbulbifer thermotolerans]MCX2795816.1 tetratricopeptide repeat protein [Microbulbifer thermotolerans]MCX2801980.1 tetratricopeptide repeat protein [Microbulbifer thermotolerans]MCX2806343.1 tetratricopeptide repeat protein [Microbulbifer thermotolerans]MCX2833751.1 tetratricopeptide repeat protein [Microbulbifer thermotolerans]
MQIKKVTKRGINYPLLAAITVLLAACASGPQQTAEISAGGPSANPYLSQARKAPAAAREGMEIARRAYEAGDMAAAETQLMQITERWPELSGPWLNLGIVQSRAGNAEAAEASLRQAISVNDLNVFAWNQLAALLRDAGRFEEALQCYQEALARWPDYSDAHRNLGILFDLYLQQPQKALEHYRAAQALREEPDKQLAGWIVDLERRL